MARNLIGVILNEVKNLDLSVGPKGEILRLRLRMTLQYSLDGEGRVTVIQSTGIQLPA